jgi:predicted metal-dependent peptidase
MSDTSVLLHDLEQLTASVLRDEDRKPTVAELDAARTLADLVFHQELGYDVIDPVLPGLLRCAGHTFQEGMLRLSCSKARLAHHLARVTNRRWNVPIGTAAVTMDPKTGKVALLLNPFLILLLGPEWTRFVLAHESRHLVNEHLRVDRELACDEVFTLATEITVNKRVTEALSCAMPRVRGDVFGIDPEDQYKKYRERANKAGLTPVSRDVFFDNDEACYQALLTLPKPPQPKNAACGHANHQEGDDSGDAAKGNGKAKSKAKSKDKGSEPQNGDQPTDSHKTGIYEDFKFPGGLGVLDRPEIDEAIRDVLHQAVKEALAGDEELKRELLGLGEEFKDSKVWGSIGLGALRGEKPVTQTRPQWEAYLQRAMASRMESSDRLTYNKKIGWWYPFFTPTGKEEQRHIAVFFDASGSISGPLVERMHRMMGILPNTTVRWFSFDTAVYDLGTSEQGSSDVQAIKGGGGTDFAPIVAKVAELEEEPDAVVVVTDGYANQINPADGWKWIWLVTEDGNGWMADLAMETIFIDERFGA